MNAHAEPADLSDPIDQLSRLEALLAESESELLEEAVPAEMMQMFSDEQWAQLIFEFQPSLRMFSADRDLLRYRQQRLEDGGAEMPAMGPTQHWLIFKDSEGQLIRGLEAMEQRLLKMALGGSNFAALADAGWPELEPDARHHQMTELLLGWLGEGLVIDAGVPIPADAEFAD